MIPTTSPWRTSKETSLSAQMWVGSPLEEEWIPRPEKTKRGGRGTGKDVAQGKVALPLADFVALAQIFNVNDGGGH